VTRAEAYLHAKFHLDSSNHLAVLAQYTNITDSLRQTGQRSDSIGQTVLQMVAEKHLVCILRAGVQPTLDPSPLIIK